MIYSGKKKNRALYTRTHEKFSKFEKSSSDEINLLLLSASTTSYAIPVTFSFILEF